MKDSLAGERSLAEIQSPKRRYQKPVLQRYGSVLELTQNVVGSCQDDGNNCATVGPGNMNPKV
jgi:hypothetical protein